MTKGDLIIIFGILIVASGSIISYFGQQIKSAEKEAEKKKLETKTGELEAPDVDITKPFTIQIGGMFIGTNIDELNEGINLRRYFNFGFDYPIEIDIRDNKLYVTTEIINEKNETVAIIKDNNWTINDNEIIARDRNYNEYAFEVIDANLIPRIQVILRPQNMIYIGGYFYTINGTLLAIPGISIINPSDSLDEYIPPIFLYPSDENLGKMNPEIILSEYTPG